MGAVRFILILGSSVSAILALIIVCVPILSPLFLAPGEVYNFPTEVKDWGGIIIGFYFGSFLTLTADLIRSLLGPRQGNAGSAD
jgi:hypothetical protein